MFFKILKYLTPVFSIFSALFLLEQNIQIFYLLFFLPILISNHTTLRYKREEKSFLEYINPGIKALIINILLFYFFLIPFFYFQSIANKIVTYYFLFELLFLLLAWIISNFFSNTITMSTKSSFGITFDALPKKTSFSTSFLPLLKNEKINSIDDLQQFINSNFPKVKYGIFDNIKDLDSAHELVIFKSKINDIKNIDLKLQSLYSFINNGGLLILQYDKFENRYQKEEFRYFDYFFHSVFPTLPFMKKFYIFVTGGKNRIISISEMWGRLHRQGFDVQHELECNDSTILFSFKNFKTLNHIAPSYSPLISLDRVGLGNKLIKIHKVRSMFPYSEFNQKKIYELNSLDSSGKFNDEFRKTPFGDVIRKYWIDEIPQIIDYLRGNIKLVGIRAMSQQYFSLYPDRYKEKYYKVKPGFISPIFDENNDSFETIINTEEEYLDSYIERPFWTDFKYFLTTFKDIIRGFRSG